MSNQIIFTDEQAMLLETAAEFCRKHSPIETVRARLDADQIDAATWREITELGWLGVNVPEEFGGLGLGLSCTVPVAESMGRNLMAVQLLPVNVWLLRGVASKKKNGYRRLFPVPLDLWRLRKLTAVGF